MKNICGYDFDHVVMMYQIYASWSEKEQIIQELANKFQCTEQVAEEMYEQAKAAVDENSSRRRFVCSYMHYTGNNYGKLDAKQMWKVYCQADGYGYQRASELRKINGGWDWSHIRDSSIEGWKRMEKLLKKYGFEH